MHGSVQIFKTIRSVCVCSSGGKKREGGRGGIACTLEIERPLYFVLAAYDMSSIYIRAQEPKGKNEGEKNQITAIKK